MRERGNGLCRRFFFEKAVFPFSRGKNRISQGVENRGSLISVPLALRVKRQTKNNEKLICDYRCSQETELLRFEPEVCIGNSNGRFSANIRTDLSVTALNSS